MSRVSGRLSTRVPTSAGLSPSGGSYWGEMLLRSGSLPQTSQILHMRKKLRMGRKKSQLDRMKKLAFFRIPGRATTPGSHPTTTVRPSRKLSPLVVSK